MHRVAFVYFFPGTNDGPCGCTCGAEMHASEFGDHRKNLGLKERGSLGVPDGYRSTLKTWHRTGARA